MSSKKQPFEQSIATLESIIAELEQGEIPLEQAIERYTQGVTLSKQCQTMLDTAEQKVTVLTEQFAKPEGDNQDETR